ncbi:hypothetical protein SKAU_G00400420 [Synaphobranchus kaupii]|uniref:Uncharacterized protein n=1 Tax=Synaphobranchus kaupii TaxID=118154 RepID=A0A9Q1E907_SYNKA|nr:hypothetical protein SKAU_G00400420 [Synaphobranchus kaupii]
MIAGGISEARGTQRRCRCISGERHFLGFGERRFVCKGPSPVATGPSPKRLSAEPNRPSCPCSSPRAIPLPFHPSFALYAPGHPKPQRSFFSATEPGPGSRPFFFMNVDEKNTHKQNDKGKKERELVREGVSPESSTVCASLQLHMGPLRRNFRLERDYSSHTQARF